MSETQISPVSSQERIEILDVLRGLAVGGILIGNMQWFSGYGAMPDALAAQAPLADKITHFLVHFFVEGKFYSIFSFLFGVGFALQIARAAERGDTKASLFKRRLFWLLVIGLLHAYLIWAGDILSVYALMGFALLLFRRKTNESLLKWAFWLMIVPIVWHLMLFILFVSFAPPDVVPQVESAMFDMWKTHVQTVPNSGYWQIISDFNLNYIVGRYMGLIFDMRLPKVLAMFLLGFYAYRKGIFQNPSEHRALIRKVMIYGLILGLIGNLTMAVLTGSEGAFPPSLAGIGGVIGYAFGVPALALGIVALITTLWQKKSWQKILEFLAPVGRMALTNYLLQSLICVFIFYGFGFGLYGKFDALYSTLIALMIFSVQIVLSAVWLKYFAYGPTEWIWRQLTYKKRLNLRRNSL